MWTFDKAVAKLLAQDLYLHTEILNAKYGFVTFYA